MKISDLLERLALGGIVVSLLTASITFTYLDSKRTRKHEEAAKYISMQEYVAAYNGGAIAELNGHINSERQKMYDKIDKIYYEKMHFCAPNNVIREAEILKDPNSSKEEKDKKIKELYYYIYRENK